MTENLPTPECEVSSMEARLLPESGASEASSRASCQLPHDKLPIRQQDSEVTLRLSNLLKAMWLQERSLEQCQHLHSEAWQD